jgi:hypothetical protein
VKDSKSIKVIKALTGHQALRPPFGFYGAKARLARRIVEILPPHRVSAAE